MVSASLAAAVLALTQPASAAPVLTFEDALNAGRVQLIQAAAQRPPRQVPQDPPQAIPKGSWEKFPAPDAATLAWLAGRIPGLDQAKVRQVPADISEALLKKAAQARSTYLDLLTDNTFRRQELYYAPAYLLAALDAKYEAGTMPVSGVDESGRPFKMVGIVAGQNAVHILYDRQNFTFKDAGKRFKLTSARLTTTIRGPGDVNLEGISTYGAAVVCPWAKMNRMTVTRPFTVRVETNCGNRDGIALNPVRSRQPAARRRR